MDYDKLVKRFSSEHGFEDWLILCWKVIPTIGVAPTPLQLDIAYHMQHGGKREIFEAFRGIGKSIICSAFVVYKLLLNPQLKIMVVSASKQRADDFSSFTLQLIELLGPLTAHLKPSKNQASSKVAFDVGPATASHSRSVTSRGITSQLTGSRADIIIADDVESWQNSQTAGMREKIYASVAEFDSILTAVKESRIIFLGTPQCEDSLYNRLRNQSYNLTIWPARVPENISAYGDNLAQKVVDLCSTELAGSPTDPSRFNDTDLLERELSQGRSVFQLQFQLDTTLSDADKYPLKLSDLSVIDIDPDMVPEKVIYGKSPANIVQDITCWGMNGDFLYRPMKISDAFIKPSYKVASIDPSGRGGDETSFAIVSTFGGQFFIHQCNGLKGGYEDHVMDELIDKFKEEKVQEIVIESNFGDGMFLNLFERRLAARNVAILCTEVRSSVQKEKRIIDTLEPLMNAHKVIISRNCLEKDLKTIKQYPTEIQRFYSLQYQLSRMTRAKGCMKHDDRVDALQIAVARLVDFAKVDTDVDIERTRTRQILETNKKWLAGSLFFNKNKHIHNKGWLS